MGSKIELILLGVVVLVTFIAFNLKTTSPTNQPQTKVQKNTEVNHFTLYEINSTTLSHTLRANRATEFINYWLLIEPNIQTQDLQYLKAKKSIYKDNIVTFIKDVKALKKNGIFYSSQKAIYKKQNKVLITPDRFLITNQKADIVRGKELIYNTKDKTTQAKDVNGTFKLKKSLN